MAFGQSSGPPATGKQIRELLELVEAAGHLDFRDARGPLGLSQRQAGGKFTRDEADALIEQLQSEVHGDGPPPGSRPARPAAPPRRSTVDLSGVAVELLAAELQRRGWIVAEP